MDVDFDAIVDALYSLPPEEFTAARNGYEKQAKNAGDKELAGRIKSLPKPNQAAWLANQLAREHRDELLPLLELGESLREATRTLAGDQLRQLSRQQRDLIGTLVQHARASAGSINDVAKRGLEETLHAALVDEGAAELLLAGHLSEPLHRSGLGESGTLAVAPVTPVRKSATTPAPKPAPAEEGAPSRVRRQLEQAEQAVAATERDRDAARARADEANEAADAAQERVSQVREELARAQEDATRAEKARRERDGALRRAEKASDDARRALATLTKRAPSTNK